MSTSTTGTVLWHGSPVEITGAFRRLTHFGTKTAAVTRLRHKTARHRGVQHEEAEEGVLYRVKVQIGAAVSVPDCSTEDNAASLLRRALSELGWSTPQIWDVMDRPISDVDRCVERGIAALEREGYRTIQYVNRVEDPGSISYVPLRPGQVEILNQRPVQAGDL